MPVKAHGTIKSIGMVIVGLAGLVIGGEWIVNGAVHMALKLGLSQSTVGLTVVAVGHIPAGTGHLGHGRLSQKC